MKLKQLVWLLLVGVVAACGGKTEKVDGTASDLVLMAEGPLYEGANTATFTWKPDLSSLIAPDFEAADLASARVTGIRISAVNAENLDLINDITFQLAGSGVSMQKVGFLNPIPAGSSSIELQLADDQKGLNAFFALSEITLVADVNVKSDLDDDLELKAELMFNFEIKSK